jgi:hypothetical protein
MTVPRWILDPVLSCDADAPYLDDPLTLEALEDQTRRLIALITQARERNDAGLTRSLRLELLATRYEIVRVREFDRSGPPWRRGGAPRRKSTARSIDADHLPGAAQVTVKAGEHPADEEGAGLTFRTPPAV